MRLVVRLPEGIEQSLKGREIALVGRGGQCLFHTMVAGDDVGIDAAHRLGALETCNCRAMLCADAFAGAAGSPAGQPCIRRARIGKQRAQRRVVAGSGVGEPPPPEGEIHPLGMKQSQPVFDQRGIGAVVVRFVSTQPEAWCAVRAAGACGIAPGTRR